MTQDRFLQDVNPFTLVMKEMGNPFEEDSADLLFLHTKEILSSEAVNSVNNVIKLGRDKFHSFARERLENKSKSCSMFLRMHACISCRLSYEIIKTV